MELVYSKVNPETATREEIKAEIARLEQKAKEYANEEQGIKIFINSIYGASASPYFVGYNIRVAEAITMQGQDLTKYASKILNRYFKDFWHKDKKIHKEMGIEGPVSKCNKEVIAYGDTDTISSDSILITNKGRITVEDLYVKYAKDVAKVEISPYGHEVIEPKDISSLNFARGKINFSKINKIIRHKSSKEKWKLKTKSGKTIIMTSDHSMVVFRNGIKTIVKPNEILKTDKILSIMKCKQKNASP